MSRSKSALGALVFAAMAGLASSCAAAADMTFKPMFLMLPTHAKAPYYAPGHAPAALQTWNGKIKYNNNTYSYSMVGTNPGTGGATTITIYLIPVKFVYGAQNGNMTFDPMVDQQNGVSIVQNLLNSPLFNSLDWKWGGKNFGNTQYIDAFQRGSFWRKVKKNPNYHVVFATPQVLSEMTLQVSNSQGSVIDNPFGSGKVGTFDISAFESNIGTWFAQFAQINPSVFPVLVADNIYLTQRGSCCIGGYHSRISGGQTYAYATYVTFPGSFSQDISAFSHEFGEWYDDPETSSRSPCGTLEVGDPIENLANYGDFNVDFNGVTWHPQAMAWLEYFGAPAKFSGNDWMDNQHLLNSVCEYGSP